MPILRHRSRAALRFALPWLVVGALSIVAAPVSAQDAATGDRNAPSAESIAAEPVDAATPEPDAATRAAATSPPSPDAAALERRIASVENDRSLDEPSREALLADLAEARTLLGQVAERRARIAALEREAAARETTLEALATELLAPVTAAPWPAPDAPVATLAAATDALDLTLADAIALLLAARRAETSLGNRASAIAGEIAEVSRRIDDLAASRAGATVLGVAVGEGSATLDAARDLAARIRRQESVALVVDLRRELATLPSRQAVAAARTRVLAERVGRLARVLERYGSALGDARVTAAGAWVVAVDRQSSTTEEAPSVDVVRDALALARRHLELVREEWLATRRSANARTALLELLEIGDTIDGIVDAGLSADDLAGLLRGLGERLPERVALTAELAATERARGVLQAERFVWNERLRERSIDDPVNVVAASLGTVPDAADAVAVPDRTRLLLTLIDVANRLSERFVADGIVLRESVARANAIETFLERSLLGLRSRESAGLAWVARVPEGVHRLTDAAAWREAGATFTAGLARYPLRAALFTLLVAGLLLARSRLRRRLGDLSARIGNVGHDGFWVTPAALLASVLRALPLPLFLAFTGLQLTLPVAAAGTFAPAVGEALGRIAPVLFALLLGRALGRHDGVLHAHFGWSDAAARQLRRQLLWLAWVALAVGLPLVLALSSGGGELRNGIGVPAFLVVSLALAAFVHTVFHPSRGVAARIAPDTPTPRAMIALYPLLLLVPLVIGALPLAGYLGTAIELQLRVFASLLMVMAITLVHGLAARTFAVAHRRFALRRARRFRVRRAAARAALGTLPVSGDAVPAAPAKGAPVPLDVERVARQTRTILFDIAVLLLLLGLWLVWRPLFPAFGASDGVALWRESDVAGAAEADGVAGGVTLGNVVVALFLIAVGFIASRNLRGLLELAVFERLRLDAGARYAIVAISGYVLVGASLVAGLSQLGVDWSKLQWIVAALGVGLGFGLQEIVANFVSGLIILFERPVRVGDVVTIGNLSGTISNIRIRATTVTDFDNLEVLLPNKTIITENVINWTLSDSVTRLLLTIGVAYGSDVERVRTLLDGVVRSTEDVLAEPVPTVFFVRHGDSALQFELRVFVATPAHRLPVTHALNARINAALVAAGIEIPFPQRAVTLRHVHGAAAGASA